MRCMIALLVMLFLPVVAGAAEPDTPILRTALDRDIAIPGQPIVLRITVLVPSWMPKPPDFPSFEVSNVIVRLPERASGPVSERIGGATWSGVTRAYRLYPMTVGRFSIAPQPVALTYADPQTRAPIAVTLRTDAIVFSGVAPDGSGDLDPFIAANALTVEQSVEGDPANMAPGDAVVRIVTAQIDGTAPIFLPELIPDIAAEGLSVYPREPEVSERAQRGVVGGTRVERVTYVAEAGGRHTVPAIRLRWYDIARGGVETIDVPGFDMTIRGAPPAPVRALSWRDVLPGIVTAIALVALAGAVFWRLRPLAAAWYRRRCEARLVSEAFAFRQLSAALSARDLGAMLNAVALWDGRLPPVSSVEEDWFNGALERLGGGLFGNREAASPDRYWSDAKEALRSVRRSRRAQARRNVYARSLPPLNPDGIT